ncbi:alpha-hydroxy-acid oxidizing protein [Rhodococcus sp. BP-252]|uniref:alpha-hydroxy acid oxidase n=1 Tax=unclassified Rhodococcus (in: high G+C Gram-positive bacteria) TaxID=192944 RepID=UPI001C9A76FF|nr:MULTISPECIES: alpha-hydroxy acid oxidase [unclassified Rhodococcus (in: high G+C Gram-positive bacteria)]MBY6412823.1 alpha-hydroxy-acid oxidizing protein [Rhodococcus sp. BP-320]MBY6417640.1 alpha-hydroxy-acid oxidizing protein [Rhodococcus sp. BP-321]MBY6423492.1 alpha-hydroxy-acid oxidizing protein [Rhodococcus sp. BP-324]MBY6427664.1 alpha-hydroxy-acid oxidizing protein [Rhodococcus sp. BP-323]MBY6432828.1 alpha-hydroxy-acid oxidizing protein [Rhodococcus sp. BP-322]
MERPYKIKRRVPVVSEVRELVKLRRPHLHVNQARLDRALTIWDIREIARKRTPAVAFDYTDGAAEQEIGIRRARSMYENVEFVPHVLRDVSTVDLRTDVGGFTADLPFGIAPTGLTRLMHHVGEYAGVTVASRSGIPFTLSTMGTVSMEEVRDTAPNAERWFQLYLWKERDKSAALIERAWNAGYRTLVLTVDTAVGGARLRDVRNGMTLPPAFGLKSVVNVASRPAWLYNLLTTDPLSFASLSKYPGAVSELINDMFDPTVSFKDLEWLRADWKGRLVVKGIQSVDDAVRAVELGADAVQLSSHGGRQLDRGPAPLQLVPSVKKALAGSNAEVYVDSGIVSGSDIVAAHAAGADFAFIGRAYLYGLMAGGEAGVQRVVDILRSDITRTLQLLGVPTISDLSSDYVRLPG